MSTLAFRPPRIEIATTETVPLDFDMADLLAAGETVQTPTTALYNLGTGISSSGGLSGSPSVVGTKIRQTVTGTGLTAKQTYRLIVSMTPTAGKTLSGELTIEVPF